MLKNIVKHDQIIIISSDISNDAPRKRATKYPHKEQWGKNINLVIFRSRAAGNAPQSCGEAPRRLKTVIIAKSVY